MELLLLSVFTNQKNRTFRSLSLRFKFFSPILLNSVTNIELIYIYDILGIMLPIDFPSDLVPVFLASCRYEGVVVDSTDTTVKVELHARTKTINVPRDHVMVRTLHTIIIVDGECNGLLYTYL